MKKLQDLVTNLNSENEDCSLENAINLEYLRYLNVELIDKCVLHHQIYKQQVDEAIKQQMLSEIPKESYKCITIEINQNNDYFSKIIDALSINQNLIKLDISIQNLMNIPNKDSSIWLDFLSSIINIYKINHSLKDVNFNFSHSEFSIKGETKRLIMQYEAEINPESQHKQLENIFFVSERLQMKAIFIKFPKLITDLRVIQILCSFIKNSRNILQNLVIDIQSFTQIIHLSTILSLIYEISTEFKNLNFISIQSIKNSDFIANDHHYFQQIAINHQFPKLQLGPIRIENGIVHLQIDGSTRLDIMIDLFHFISSKIQIISTLKVTASSTTVKYFIIELQKKDLKRIKLVLNCFMNANEMKDIYDLMLNSYMIELEMENIQFSSTNKLFYQNNQNYQKDIFKSIMVIHILQTQVQQYLYQFCIYPLIDLYFD